MPYHGRLLASAALLLALAGHAHAQEIYGWIEPVGLPGAGLRLMAKLDTGADTSSLDASAIRRVRRGDKRLVKFRVRDPQTEEMIDLEREYVRSARIVRHSGNHQIRHVVNIEICLGETRRVVEVNLIDRSNFAYPFLLGRAALAGIALVDPSVTETSEPDCEEDADEEVAS